ncbi:MAG: histidine phosphatase family protein [Planctomycetes bacterium]|nr:histidine phosphatase family protein [Planctomycetota bacterium]MCW8134675.1 histidine phosphatase family protein [Planctomycetota bacterium]
MPTLYLIRHAEPQSPYIWNGADSTRPLSEAGRKQAQRMGQLLAKSGATELRSAPHRRCVETAELIGQLLGLKPVIDESLHIARRFDLPQMEGTAIWVAHSNNIPGALERAGIDCHACDHAGAWRVDFDDEGGISGASYLQP